MSTPMSTVRVAAVQMEPKLGEVEANLRLDPRQARRGDEAAGAKLVVFPECALSGYGFESKEEAMAVRRADPRPLDPRDRWPRARPRSRLRDRRDARAGRRPAVQRRPPCSARRAWSGRIARSTCRSSGSTASSTPATGRLEVFDAGGIRVGMHICYDGAFPETGRVLTLLGADVLVLPTNWPIQSVTTAEHLPACRAIENVVYVMAVDRVGEESEAALFAGLSSIADPGGVILAKAGPVEEEILYADVDPAIARRKRLVRVPGQVRARPDRRPPAVILRPDRRAERQSGKAGGIKLAPHVSGRPLSRGRTFRPGVLT